jgi:hypothetical protein
MRTVTEIENAIKNLSPKELAEFRLWYSEFDADSWDQQIAEDSQSGRLDFLIDEANEESRSGKLRQR